MHLYKNDTQKYFAGLIIIFVIYTAYYFYFVDSFFTTLPLMHKHFLLVGIAFLVYYIGTVHLGKLQQSWMLFLWHIIHISLLSTLIAINLYKMKSGNQLPYAIQHLSDNIKEILISPMLYFLMGLLNRLLVLEQNKI